jgi:hypothetical protein
MKRLFAANAIGQAVAAAVVLRVSAASFVTNEAIARFDPQQNRHVAVPLNLGSEGDLVFLQLFGTGASAQFGGERRSGGRGHSGWQTGESGAHEH